MSKGLKAIAAKLLDTAGIVLNGNNPWDPLVHNENFYSRVLKDGSLALGETYMDAWWDCASLDVFFEKILRAKLETKIQNNFAVLLKLLLMQFFNPQSKIRSLDVGRQHYDLGNNLYKKMLDSRLNYSCAYWDNAEDLEQAQINKLDLCCQKLLLKPGLRILDIGCGWGGFAQFAAEHYGVEVVGITISREQEAYAKAICAHLPIEIRFQDYRDMDEKFDRIISIGMFEHVGPLNYSEYFKIARTCLKDDGLFLLHTIGHNESSLHSDPWTTEYIFPGAKLPSIQQIAKATEGKLIMEDWHNLGVNYDKTLMAWHKKFNANWDELKKHYDDRFRRMWNYYLLSSAGSFRARNIQLWQIVFSKDGLLGGYRRPKI